MTDRLSSIRDTLRRYSQEHLLTFYDELGPAGQFSLLQQIERIDFEHVSSLINRFSQSSEPHPLPNDLEPATYYKFHKRGNNVGYDVQYFRTIGEELIRGGKVAAFTVAGGQGTRLGWNGPKGTFPATVVTSKPLFRVLAEQITATQERYNVVIPWYIMTSPMNDAQTRSFFADNNNFGLSRRNIFMFPQGVIPSFERETGKLILKSKGEIAVNPDGHGGSIIALRLSGALQDLQARGIEHISYFQVDNPLVRAIDPLFVGLHAAADDSSAEVSSKMVAKSVPEERVGVFCRSENRTCVIEYSDLPESLANERNSDGSLRYHAGSIAVHILGVKFVQELTSDPDQFALPYHRAERIVPCVDPESGESVTPTEPNATKLETFLFDAIPLAQSSIIYETDRIEEFAPIKNATGSDSLITSQQIQSDRHAQWLEQHGVSVSRDDQGHSLAKIEFSPLTALESDDLASVELPQQVTKGMEIAL